MGPLLSEAASAAHKLRTVREKLWRAGDAKWAFTPLEAPFLGPVRPRTLLTNLLIALAAVPALLWPLGLVPIAAWVLAWTAGLSWPWIFTLLVTPICYALLFVLAYGHLRRIEASDEPDDIAPDPTAVAALMAGENHCSLNHLVVVTQLKPGVFRRLTLRAVLWVTSQALARSGRPGFLGELASVHYARWILLRGTDQLVFFSNYDGSWEHYLEEFIDLVPYALTSIWSNCRGFPRTRLLFGLGAADGDRFRRWVRRRQIPTPFWYAAYPELTLSRIRVNARIRLGIATAKTRREAGAWLALFGAPSPPSNNGP
jgi:hypothetical protein